VFSNLFSITLPNIEKYFPGIHFTRNSLSKKKTTFQQTNGAKEIKVDYYNSYVLEFENAHELP
jgi:hypothetical protein